MKYLGRDVNIVLYRAVHTIMLFIHTYSSFITDKTVDVEIMQCGLLYQETVSC
jgi:hypothetical protein